MVQTPSTASALSSIGGESLQGSGFENETPQGGFSSSTIAPDTPTPSSESSTGARPDNASGTTSFDRGADPIASQSPQSTGAVSDVSAVSSMASPSQSPPTRGKPRRGISRAVDHVRGLRRRLSGLSDAAPHATPPKMPFEHED